MDERCHQCPTHLHALAWCPGVHPTPAGRPATPNLCRLHAHDPAFWARKIVDFARSEEGSPLVEWPTPPPPPKPPTTTSLTDTRRVDEHEFITTARLAGDTVAFLRSVPADVDLVVGISRSGLLPGSIVSYHRHLPLYAVSRQSGVTDPGHGGRMDGPEQPPPAHILLVDDTIASGREMSACAAIVRERFPSAKITRAAIYARPEGAWAADLLFAIYPGLHYLEWNWSCAGHGEWCGYDFDGILCRDFTVEECRDDETYLAAMKRLEPIHLPRRAAVPLIVTARPEWARDVTLEWLSRWRVRVDKLIMWPGAAHPPSAEVAPWKARHYAESQCNLFAESDPWQAEEINRITNRPVLCPAALRLFPRRAPDPAPWKRLQALVNECPSRGGVLYVRDGCRCEIRECAARKGPMPGKEGEVSNSDCLACKKEEHG